MISLKYLILMLMALYFIFNLCMLINFTERSISDIASNVAIPANSTKISPKLSINYTSDKYAGGYCVVDNVIQSTGRNGTITMMLHTSANYFHQVLLRTISKWDGRVSLAVMSSDTLWSDGYRESTVANTIRRIVKLAACHKFIKESVNAHVFFRWNSTKPCPTITLDNNPSETCRTPTENLLPFKYYTTYGMYPVNTARNIARLYSTSEYFLLADMEQEYSEGAEYKLRKLADKWQIKKRKWVVVVRRFEYDQLSIRVPRNLDDLRKTINKSTFVFHSLYFPKGHSIERLSKWLANNDTKPHVVDMKTLKHPYWEPMFVAHRSTLYHDETIPYGKRNHVTMVQHLCLTGYLFAIAPEVFNMHAGVHRKEINRHLPQNIAQRELKEFTEKMVKRYPENARQCLKLRTLRSISPTVK